MLKTATLSLAGLVLCLGLGACTTVDKLSRVGKAPDLTPITDPTTEKNYRPVSTPQPRKEQPTFAPNSLWRSDATTFFKDQRAAEAGDILTVMINITDRAQVNNSTARSRTSAEDANLTNFLGFEGRLGAVLPDGVDPSSLTNFGSTSSTQGSGTIDRQEVVSLTIAAMVVQELPNGNLVIQGRQEVRVNHEVRELLLTGIVRPQDIKSDNTIEHTQIAEARISYGGKGHLSDVQQARWGQQIYDILFPY